VTDPKYAAFAALDPFFEISQQGLPGLVDGDHYFDTIADDAVFEFRYIFPGWPQTLNGREALMALYAGYGNNIVLHGADASGGRPQERQSARVRFGSLLFSFPSNTPMDCYG
jgi:hypothetical protein